MQRIGFIGIGLMGQQMAPHLLEAGHPLTIWNRTQKKAEALVQSGAQWAGSPKALALKSDVVITMVTDAAASEAVICGPAGILEGAHDGLIIVDMGSIAPEMSRSIANRARDKGIPMLDAPVTGNPKVAAAGKLGIMVGGPKDIYNACLPILDLLAAKIVYAGKNGMGTTLKLINNLILGVAIQAVSEALVLSAKAGIDPQKVIEITSVGGARTGAMETRGPKMVRRNFTAGFSTNNMYKDLSSVIQLADDCGASVPTTSVAWDFLRAAKTQGKGDLDSCSVMTILEQMANVTVNMADSA